MLWKMLVCISNAVVVYWFGLGFAVSSKGPDSSSVWALVGVLAYGARVRVEVLLGVPVGRCSSVRDKR